MPWPQGSLGNGDQASFRLQTGARVARRGFIGAAGVLLVMTACAPRRQPSLVGGPFHLIDQNGRPVDQRILRGKWTAVFFGYTFCPDVCPTTLTTLGQASTLLGSRAENFQVVFISVDPARDSPAALKLYLSNPAFPKGAIGLTGTPAQVAATAAAYRVYYKKAGVGPDYSVDHTAIVYLMDPKGRFSQPLDAAAEPAQVARQIAGAMKQG